MIAKLLAGLLLLLFLPAVRFADEPSWEGSAVVLNRTRDDKALADYDKMIEQDPEFDWAYHVRGWIYYRRMDYDKALADYEQAIKLVPT